MISRTLRLAHRLLRIAGLEERVQFYAKNQKIPEADLRKLAKADPTDGKYLGWLIKNVVDPGSMSDEWLGRIRQALDFFNSMSKSKKLLEHIDLPTDINQANLDQVYDAWVAHKDEDPLFARERVEKAKKLGTKVVYNTPPYKIVEVGGEGTDPGEAVLALCYFGINKWCTKHPKSAKEWLESGRVWVVFKNGRSLLQTDGVDVRDVKNKIFSWANDQDLLRLLVKLGIMLPHRLQEELDRREFAHV